MIVRGYFRNEENLKISDKRWCSFYYIIKGDLHLLISLEATSVKVDKVTIHS